jgi:hypothetical protein
MHRPDPRESARAAIVAVAQAMMAGQVNLIDGVRQITDLRHGLEDPDASVFFPIRAIASETDHFPIGPVRAHYARESLERIDAEMQRYLADAKNDILAACADIVRVYS